MSIGEPSPIEVWSRVVRQPASDGPEDVVLAPPDADPEPAIAIAWSLLARGRRVRIVGRGVTTPSFAAKLPTTGGVVLTELDAYLPADKRPSQQALAVGLGRWLEAVFGDAVAGVSGRDAFWSSASTRLGLQDVFDAWCFASGLAENHSSSRFIMTERGWLGAQILSSLVTAKGGAVEPVDSRRARLLAALSVAVLGGAAAIASILLRIREFVREAPSRQLINSLPKTAHPEVWLGVNGAWEFSSRHILEPLGAHAQRTGLKVGVLLQSSIRPGKLGDAHRETSDNSAVLPVLSSAVLSGAYSRVEQVVSYSSWLQFVAAMPGTCVAMARATFRAATKASEVDFGLFKLSVSETPTALVRLTTLDVLRAREAAHATRCLVRTAKLAGGRIALSQASLVADAVPDLILQSGGAETLDVVHGALAEPLDMVTTARTCSTRKLLWTNSEARYLAGQLKSVCVGAAPSRVWLPQPHSEAHQPLRVLVLSNYGTFIGSGHRRLPRLGYQEHLLDNVKGLLARAQRKIALRWRPHPGDNRQQVQLACSAFGPDLSLSESKRLEVDLAWADIFIASLSSTVVEALAWERPLLIHDVPIHEAAVLMPLFDKRRRFRNVDELETAFVEATRQVDSEAPFEQEQELRKEFFGPSGIPKPIAEFVFPRT